MFQRLYEGYQRRQELFNLNRLTPKAASACSTMSAISIQTPQLPTPCLCGRRCPLEGRQPVR